MDDYNSLNEDLNDKLKIWVDEIKHINAKTIIYSMSDINYKSRFEEMIDTYNIPNVCFAMCAFDIETYDFFKNRGVPTILLDKHKNKFGHLVCISKFLLTYFLIKNNYNVIMSEADIFWKVDVYKIFENDDTELLVSSHTYSEEVNIGFYRVISNKNTIDFFYNLISWIYDTNSEYKKLVYEDRFLKNINSGTADQKIFDCALRHCNDTRLKTVGYAFTQKSLDCLQNIKLNWNYISCEILMHYPITFPNNHKGIHIWSGYSTPENQIKYAHSYHWYYNKD